MDNFMFSVHGQTVMLRLGQEGSDTKCQSYNIKIVHFNRAEILANKLSFLRV